MKTDHCISKHAIVLFLGVAGAWTITSQAALGADQQDPITQRMFDSPADATNVLVHATKAHDQTEVREIFGPEVTNLLTGDKVQDERNFDSFAAAMQRDCQAVPETNGQIFLEIGNDHWPFPIPLVQTNGKWAFDTIAGEEEIINRQVGADEFYAIGVCQAYVRAQRKYSEQTGHYSATIKSVPGKGGGLSLLPPAVADAEVRGHYARHGKHPRAYHGYLFKVLSRQGADAPGGAMTYVSGGKMTKGFALVAFPVRWGQSGVMSFIVGQDGTIRQRSLGETTPKIASAMTDYDPDSQWTVVQDQGITKLEERK